MWNDGRKCIQHRLELILKTKLRKLRARNAECLRIEYFFDALFQWTLRRNQFSLLQILTLEGSYLFRECFEIDFEAFSKEVTSFESEYLKQRELVAPKGPLEKSVEKILDPKALCISSPQFTQLGFENQLQTVLNAFPAVVPHQRVFSSSELRMAISDDRTVDIVHIAAFVCPRSGDLYFSDVNLNTGESIAAEPDSLTPDSLASLLQL